MTSAYDLPSEQTQQKTSLSFHKILSNDRGKVDSNSFCYAATVLSPHRNVLILTQRMHKPI